MSTKSSIAWVNPTVMVLGKHIAVDGATWNFIYGCRKISPLCLNCYAMYDVHRMAGHENPKVSGGKGDLTQITNGRPNWTGKFLVVPERLAIPAGWKRPKVIFVNSLSDLFYGGAKGDIGEFSYADFCIFMAAVQHAPQHVYQVLTKRFQRCGEYLRKYAREFGPRQLSRYGDGVEEAVVHRDFYATHFPQVWWGFSAGTQSEFDQASEVMRSVPGANRWLSMEPLLEPVNIRAGIAPISWIVTGGESKAGARWMDLDWVRSLITQARETGTPLFVKQLGEPWAKQAHAGDRKGEHPIDWPEDLRVREWPEGIAHLQRQLTDYYTRNGKEFARTPEVPA